MTHAYPEILAVSGDLQPSPVATLEQIIKHGVQEIAQRFVENGIKSTYLLEICTLADELSVDESVDYREVKAVADEIERPDYSKAVDREFRRARAFLSGNVGSFMVEGGEVEQQKITPEHQQEYLTQNSVSKNEYTTASSLQAVPTLEDEVAHQAGLAIDEVSVVFEEILDLANKQPKQTTWKKVFKRISNIDMEPTQEEKALEDSLEKLERTLSGLKDNPSYIFGNLIGNTRKNIKTYLLRDVQEYLARANSRLRVEISERTSQTPLKRIQKLGAPGCTEKTRPDIVAVENVRGVESTGKEVQHSEGTIKPEVKNERVETVAMTLPWVNGGSMPKDFDVHITEENGRSVGYISALIERTDKISERARNKTKKPTGDTWFDESIKRTVELLLSGADPNKGDAVFRGRIHERRRGIKSEFKGLPIYYDGSRNRTPSRIYVGYCDTRNSEYMSDKTNEAAKLPDIILFILAETSKQDQLEVLMRLSGAARAVVNGIAK